MNALWFLVGAVGTVLHVWLICSFAKRREWFRVVLISTHFAIWLARSALLLEYHR